MPDIAYANVLCGLAVGLSLGAATGCGTDDGTDDVPSVQDDGLDPIAGLRDDCKQTVRRGLYFLGLPTSRTTGTAFSRYDNTTDRFWPLALSLGEDASRFSHGDGASGGGSQDPRCDQIVEEIYFDGLIAGNGIQLDTAKYPEGRANIDIGVELHFDGVAFPRAASEIEVPFNPATRERISVSAFTVEPTRMDLVVTHLRPLTSSSSAVVKEQKFPLQFECEKPFPVQVSWEPESDSAPVHSLCPRNDAGDAYCLTYNIRHGGGDCRFAIPSFALDTIQGEHAAAGIAGALTRIIENDKQVGVEVTVDTIALGAQ